MKPTRTQAENDVEIAAIAWRYRRSSCTNGYADRARDRELDIAIAACAIVSGGTLWTLNRDDFKDIPHLRLV
ncbi:MAG TPA: hypothetical protein VKB36_10480 [Vicinamibacterales bacterium]|nr:hypothetical protein [Vicinamibacterales bacterium]